MGLVEREGISLTQNGRALKDVLQFADIARPVVAFQHTLYLIGNVLDVSLQSLRILADEVPNQGGDIARPVPQRRQADRKDIQPIVKIRPKLTTLNQC